MQQDQGCIMPLPGSFLESPQTSWPLHAFEEHPCLSLIWLSSPLHPHTHTHIGRAGGGKIVICFMVPISVQQMCVEAFRHKWKASNRWTSAGKMPLILNFCPSS